MDKYEVEYLQHSLFKDCEKVKKTVTVSEVIDLFENGMVTVLLVKRLV